MNGPEFTPTLCVLDIADNGVESGQQDFPKSRYYVAGTPKSRTSTHPSDAPSGGSDAGSGGKDQPASEGSRQPPTLSKKRLCHRVFPQFGTLPIWAV